MRSGRLLIWALFLGVAGYAGARINRLETPPSSPESLASSPEALAPPAPQGPPFRVLFIGNSLTHSSGMPEMLQGLARAAGINLEFEQHTPGGARLIQHASDPAVQASLRAGRWNAVVLQEQGQWPAFADDQVRREVDPYAAELARQARQGSPSTRVLLYMTPARQNGDRQNASNIPEVATYSGMQSRINQTYRRLAWQLGASVVPAGAAWQVARRDRPDLNLYNDDLHPNREGAYLIACVFFGRLFDRSPVGSAYTAGVPEPIASGLQRIAWQAVVAERAR